MSQKEFRPARRSRFSLSVRVSTWLVFTAIIPLLITLGFSYWQASTKLTEQARAQMTNDAKTRVQLIDNYLTERLFDAGTLTQVPSLQQFLAAPKPPPTAPKAIQATYADAAVHASYSLLAGRARDTHYVSWELFDAQSNFLFANPTADAAQKHGQYTVPPQYLQEFQTSKGKPFVSDVYYSPTTKKATVDIYAPIFYTPGTPGTPGVQPQFVGFVRAILNLDTIWSIVKDDTNGAGSYAFILDNNGVRIADTDPQRLFTSVDTLAAPLQDSIKKEARYGNTNDVISFADTEVANALGQADQTRLFQSQPYGQTEQFQVVRQKTAVLPWSYYVLSPVSTVTAVANTQFMTTIEIAAVVSLLVAVIGFFIGRRLAGPILTSVEYLRRSSESLSTLATKQQDAAAEQMWVVDSSQVGLQSVQYYTEATAVAARQLSKTGTELVQRWGYLDANEAKKALERIISAAQYIENASQYQNVSNQKLATALKVATQVTEQLVAGTTSATDAASQLERVVGQLRAVAGK